MNRTLPVLFAFAILSPVAAHAQIGWSVTFDPTQAAHAVSQIAEAEKTYTTTVQTTENVINAYNLAKRMASSPSSLYSSYGSGLPPWIPMLPSNNTYGNTSGFFSSLNSGVGSATSALSQASIAHMAQLTGYQNLDAQTQRTVAAQGATIDMGDTVSATTTQALGTIRANQTQRQADIANLETQSHSLDPSQQTELATLQRINQALLLLLRTAQDLSQMGQTQNMQQLVSEKQQLDGLKIQMQAAQDFQTNYKAAAPTETQSEINRAMSY